MTIYKSEHTDQPGPVRRFFWRVTDRAFGWRGCGSNITSPYTEITIRCCLPRWHPGKHTNGRDSSKWVRWGYGDDLGEWWGAK